MKSKPPVSTPAEGRRPYHHGALREALIDATEQLLAEQGLEGFSLREVARRAGVSPAAPMHHFGDARGLLTAVAVRAFEELASRLEAADAASDGRRRDRLRRQGLAYVRFALERPGLYDLMFRAAKLDWETAELQVAGHRAFWTMAGLFAKPAPPGDMTRPPAAVVVWSLVHGFSRLALDGQLGPLEDSTFDALFQISVGDVLDAIGQD
jgi:AcrR family transcriptional regulator